ncbi:hypothetical protein OKW45_000004 [Paraburkholderia sp. WSM4175]|uniref:hypothetical protein n=1 Tax=Paraburkholderia sp. WSM4175 TaxID=2991072 RepID=UPI003D1F228A
MIDDAMGTAVGSAAKAEGLTVPRIVERRRNGESARVNVHEPRADNNNNEGDVMPNGETEGTTGSI